MKLSVLANLYGAKTLDETLSILTSLGVHTVEIGAGGIPARLIATLRSCWLTPRSLRSLWQPSRSTT